MRVKRKKKYCLTIAGWHTSNPLVEVKRLLCKLIFLMHFKPHRFTTLMRFRPSHNSCKFVKFWKFSITWSSKTLIKDWAYTPIKTDLYSKLLFHPNQYLTLSANGSQLKNHTKDCIHQLCIQWSLTSLASKRLFKNEEN